MFRRSESTGWWSPFSSGKNFWIVVKTTPPASGPPRGRRAGLVGPGPLRNTRDLGGSQRLLDGDVHGVELVVPSHLLGEAPAADVLKHDEVAHEIEETAVVEHPFQDHLELREKARCDLPPCDGAPRLEP